MFAWPMQRMSALHSNWRPALSDNGPGPSLQNYVQELGHWGLASLYFTGFFLTEKASSRGFRKNFRSVQDGAQQALVVPEDFSAGTVQRTHARMPGISIGVLAAPRSAERTIFKQPASVHLSCLASITTIRTVRTTVVSFSRITELRTW